MEENKSSWGGSRQGAGRKPKGDSPRVMLGVSIPPEVKQKLVDRAKELGISVSELIVRLAEHLDV